MRKPLINPGIIKRLKSFFAIIQDTDTATRYIPAGKYVLYKNIACHASQNIESGDTLALGTNLVTDSDGFVNCLNDGLKTKVNTSDIVNALTSTDSTKPLSAAQGKVLNDGLTTINSNITDRFGKSRVLKFLNVSTISFELPFAPSSSLMANGLLYNANQQLIALIKLDQSPAITRTNGALTLTLAVSNKTVTITSSGTLWGITNILLDWNY